MCGVDSPGSVVACEEIACGPGTVLFLRGVGDDGGVVCPAQHILGFWAFGEEDLNMYRRKSLAI